MKLIDVSIDPGDHCCAWAAFSTNSQLLVGAGFIEGKDSRHALADELVLKIDRTDDAVHANRAVVEVPQIYQLRAQKGDQNDLVSVSLTAGAIGHALHAAGFAIKEVRPGEWKGQIPKEVTQRRVRRTLLPKELERICWPSAKSLCHNVYDAVHLGLRQFTERPA